MINPSAIQVLSVLTGWLDRQERQAVAYLMEEDRILRRQLGRQRLQFTDHDRRRLAVHGHRLGRRILRKIASVVTPDTILRWHRQPIVRKWTYAHTRSERHSVILAEIRRLVVRMAKENPTWGFTCIQGALKNVGHRVGRSTIARILKVEGLAPVPGRPTSWRTFLRALGCGGRGGFLYHGSPDVARIGDVLHRVRDRPRLAAHPDRGVDTASRQPVHATGKSPLTAADGVLSARRVLICDRDAKWSEDVRQLLDYAGVHVVRTPFRAPNANAYAERFVRAIKHECLNRIVPLGEQHFRRALKEFVDHYHRERNHQGLENRLIDGSATERRRGCDPSASATRRLAELLRASGVTTDKARHYARLRLGTLRGSGCRSAAATKAARRSKWMRTSWTS